MYPTRRNCQSKKSHGFSLIEILVAIAVFGFGMLGLANLQLATLRSNQSAAHTATAVRLARDYEEILQLLPSTSILAGNTVLGKLDTSIETSHTQVDCQGISANCSNLQFADYMLNDWKSRVITDLPGGRAMVCLDSAPRDTSTTGEGLYHWDCNNQGDVVMLKLGWFSKTYAGKKTASALTNDKRPRLVMSLNGNQ